MTYLVQDPFNNRVKVFKQDYDYNLPTLHGLIYDFEQEKVLIMHDQQKTCFAEQLTLTNGDKMAYFKQLRDAWKPANTKYYGRVKVQYSDGSFSAPLHLFVNQV